MTITTETGSDERPDRLAEAAQGGGQIALERDAPREQDPLTELWDGSFHPAYQRWLAGSTKGAVEGRREAAPAVHRNPWYEEDEQNVHRHPDSKNRRTGRRKQAE